MTASPSEESAWFFSSRRERRLWIWTAVIVVTIYATLGLASTLAGVLDQNVLAILFVTGMLLVAISVLTQGLRARPGGVEIGVAVGISVVYFMVFVRLAVAERSHLIEYSVVAVFIYEALTERARNGRRVYFSALSAILATALIGSFDECIQAVLPSRVFEWTDMLFNFLAGLMAVTAMVILGWARRFRTKASGRNSGHTSPKR